jgi:hypothetical protein
MSSSPSSSSEILLQNHTPTKAICFSFFNSNHDDYLHSAYIVYEDDIPKDLWKFLTSELPNWMTKNIARPPVNLYFESEELSIPDWNLDISSSPPDTKKSRITTTVFSKSIPDDGSSSFALQKKAHGWLNSLYKDELSLLNSYEMWPGIAGSYIEDIALIAIHIINCSS